MGYRNCVYNSAERCMHLFTWDKEGNRVKYDVSYNPYLYIEDSRGSFTSIFNTKLVKKNFQTSFDKNKFVRESGVKRLFENFLPVQHYLLDTFWRENEKLEFSSQPLKIYHLDIETYSVDSFPNPENPTHTVNVITIHDSLSNKFYSWGLKPYTGDNKNLKYIYCTSEQDLFIKFTEFLAKDYPDVITGWNIEFFDIPYIINRCTKILGEEYTNRLSPVNRVHFRDVMGKFGRPQRRYYIDGTAVIDYLDIYKRFTFKEHESYKLDSIAEVELGENKIDYEGKSLHELADTEWNKFIDYNVQDVSLTVKLDDKLQFIALLRMMAYAGLCTLEQAMGTLSVINGALCIKAREQGKVVSTFVRSADEGKNPGAYVGEPRSGFQEYVVSFDANSLYPNVMISLNLSPETKIGKAIKKDDGNYLIEHVSGKNFELDKTKFIEFLNKEEIALTKANFMFTQKFKGIVPQFVDYYYQKRVEVKEELKKLKVEQSKLKKASKEYKDLANMIDRLNARQMCIKVLINSCYGYFGNKMAPIGDDDIASSITLTGQAVIKQSNELIKRYVREKIDGVTNEQIEQCIIYNDTDSSYVSIAPFVRAGLQFRDDKGLTQATHDRVNDIENYLNVEIKKWGARTLNSKDCRFVFKRESIGDVGLFLQKKRYVLHVLDDEGIPCNKFKYTGVEVVRTTMPKAIKPYAKQIIETMLMTKSMSKTNEVLNECYDIFKKLSLTDLAFVMGLKGYEKYSSQCNDFTTAKGMPLHVKSAYYHNLLLKKLNIDDKYETIGSGDKIRYVYLEQPNKYGIESIGFKYEFPTEFEKLFKPDYDKMFNKILFSMIERFYDNVKWTARKPADNVQCELFDLFG